MEIIRKSSLSFAATAILISLTFVLSSCRFVQRGKHQLMSAERSRARPRHNNDGNAAWWDSDRNAAVITNACAESDIGSQPLTDAQGDSGSDGMTPSRDP